MTTITKKLIRTPAVWSEINPKLVAHGASSNAIQFLLEDMKHDMAILNADNSDLRDAAKTFKAYVDSMAGLLENYSIVFSDPRECTAYLVASKSIDQS